MNRNGAIIHVAVFVEGNEGYGIQKSLISQYRASKEYGIDFRYVCLQKGELCRKLSDLGADVRVIGGTKPEAYPPALFKSLVVFFSHLEMNLAIFKKVRVYLSETRPDSLYTHIVTEHILGGLAAKSCGIKSIGHFRRMLNTKRNLGLSRIILSVLLNFSLDRGIAVSNSARRSLWGPIKRRTQTIYNGVNIQEIRETGKMMADNGDCPAADLICIGRITAIKKQDVLIHALGILAREGLQVKTLMVGGGAADSNPYYRKLTEQISSQGLEEGIVFTGFVSVPYGMISRAKVSILCCTREGCPNAVVESMACKTPVVVADAGGAGELVEDGVTGLKFPPDDAIGLAECLKRLLLDQQLRESIAEKAFSWTKEKFNCDKHMAQLREIFAQVIDRKL